MPIDSKRLLEALKKQVKTLEQDLRAQADVLPALAADLQAEWQRGRDANRTNDTFKAWREGQVTQAAVHWVLGCVFVRFLEDNGLVPEPWLAGPVGERLDRARDRRQAFFADPARRTEDDRHWLEHAFSEVAALPAAGGLFDRAHNPVWRWPLSPDAAGALVRFWREVDPNAGALVHDFTDPAWETRFLGDLYQDLSKEAKKKYALLQTPVFVEEFILDRTLEPAIGEFGLDVVRCIDPTCGSGHFLLGAFQRLLTRWQQREPATPERALVQRALDGVYGVDLNPFAVAIARFRLLVAALKASGLARLAEAPAYTFHLAVGDSLYHGQRAGELGLGLEAELAHPDVHGFAMEDVAAADRILGQHFHAVVGNPPYIAVRDRKLNQLYRGRYSSCHMRYALSVPFAERFFQLSIAGDRTRPAGYVGMITANSFMKREFGTKLVQQFFPTVDLTHVLDVAGAYIPGHGTPTVILFGRHRAPVTDTLRVVMGARGEPGKPTDPAQGKVWTAVVKQVDVPGSESIYASVVDAPRALYAKHPWSLGGGGATDAKVMIETAAETTLGDLASEVGIAAVTGADEFFLQADSATARRRGVEFSRDVVIGDAVRDWSASAVPAIWPYDEQMRVRPLADMPGAARCMWLVRAAISLRRRFGTPMVELGYAWYEWQELYREKLKSPLTITYSEVATHNHFTVARGGMVFKNTAPVVKLPAKTKESTHLGLLGLLNSSVACFWLKQVCHNKGSTVDAAGARQRTMPFEDFFQFNSTKVAGFPVTKLRPTDLATRLDALARERDAHLPDALSSQGAPTRETLANGRHVSVECLKRMIALQEELDWRCYSLYGITVDELTYRDSAGKAKEPPPLALGQRAFEIALARQVEDGEEETTWFDRHGSTPITELPSEWPDDYRTLVERRIALIEEDRYVGLLERPEYKRRWNLESWEKQQERVLRTWLLNRLESPAYWPEVHLQTVRQLADRAQGDAEFRAVGELLTGDVGFDVAALVRDLVGGEAVPFLPVLRYRDSGLLKRHDWEETWAKQRAEDAIDAAVAAELPRGADESAQAHAERLTAEVRRRRVVAGLDAIPRPPRYGKEDFASDVVWGLRGPLDVPKERFVSYPHAEREADASLPLAWAGWTALQQAHALAAWYNDLADVEGADAARVTPVLAGLAELVPWLRQWYNDVDQEFGQRLGDFYGEFVVTELHRHGLTAQALRDWRPPATARRRRATRTRRAAASTS